MDFFVFKVTLVGILVFVVLLDVLNGGDDNGTVHFDVDSRLIAHRYTHTNTHIVVDAVCNADFRVTWGICNREQFPILVDQTNFPDIPAAHIGRDNGCCLDDILVHQIPCHLCRPAPYFMN